MTTRTNRGGLVWAIIGGLVLLGGLVAIIVSGLVGNYATPTPPEPAPTSTQTPSESDPPQGAVVDPSASERGWVPEPITDDPETYIRAALAAASTFDTTLGSRDEWLAYLDTWFTPDTRYADPAEQQEAMDASQLELRQGVVLPEQEWDALAREDGRVHAITTGEVELEPVSDDASGDMRTGTADVMLTFTSSDGNGAEASYDETVRVRVQVLCGEASVPTASSDQRAGDCKVIRYFAGPSEP